MTGNNNSSGVKGVEFKRQRLLRASKIIILFMIAITKTGLNSLRSSELNHQLERKIKNSFQDIPIYSCAYDV